MNVPDIPALERVADESEAVNASHYQRFVFLVDEVLEEVRSGVVIYSSVVAEAVLLPVDTLRLQQQLLGCGLIDTLRQVVDERGVSGLYHGLVGRVLQSIASAWGFFIGQTVLRSLFMGRLNYLIHRRSRNPHPQLAMGSSLIVDLLAQLASRLVTNPVDVVANVNQVDWFSTGLTLTCLRLMSVGGLRSLWRGFSGTAVASCIPSLMFSTVGSMKDFVLSKCGTERFSCREVFWITAVSKVMSTLFMYPLLRARVMMHIHGSGLIEALSAIIKREGWRGLYRGIVLTTVKTILFNALVMALVRELSAFLFWRASLTARHPRRAPVANGPWRNHIRVINGVEAPWEAAARGASVGYVDGSWSCLYPGQLHVLNEAALRSEHLVVGIHCDWCLRDAIGHSLPDKYDVRKHRLSKHSKVTSILEGAPWVVPKELIAQVGIGEVFSGSTRKDKSMLAGRGVRRTASCASVASMSSVNSQKSSACFTMRGLSSDSEDDNAVNKSQSRVPQSWDEQLDDDTLQDPYVECKRLGIYEEIPSLDSPEREAIWFKTLSTLLFSSPGAPAAKCWEILCGPSQRPWPPGTRQSRFQLSSWLTSHAVPRGKLQSSIQRVFLTNHGKASQ